MAQKTIAYTLRVSPKARHIRLAVYGDGRVVLTVPKFTRPGFAEKFLQAKSAWLNKHLELIRHSPSNIDKIDIKQQFSEHKQSALVLVQDRIKDYNLHYNLPVGKISVKNTKTRWGSCSKKGNLSFNYKIALLPELLQNYLVVHELCHIQEFNHSKTFWNLVAETIPDYKVLRKQLKTHEH